MNYIKQLKNENEKLKNSIEEAINELIEHQRYFLKLTKINIL